MRIMKTNITNNLPYEISKCTGAVFAVLDDGMLYPINRDQGTLQFFKTLWNCNGLHDIQLSFENNADVLHILHKMIEGKGAA